MIKGDCLEILPSVVILCCVREWNVSQNLSQGLSVWEKTPQRDTLYMGIQQSQDKCPGIRPQDGVSWDPRSQS